MRVIRVLVGIALVLSIAGVAAGVVALVSRPASASPAQVRSADRQISALKASLSADSRALASTRADIVKLQSSTTNGQVTTLQGDVRHMSGQLAKLRTCLPQLQAELGGMSIQQDTQGGFVTNAYIQNPTIISTDCTSTLYGKNGGA